MASSKLDIIINLVDRASRGLKNMDASVKRTAEGFRQVGRSLALAGGAITGLGLLGVRTFARFEQTMARVGAISGATASEMEALERVAREMGRTTVFTANESAEALQFMAMAGMNAQMSIEALPSVLQLASAGAIELGQAADIVTNVMAGMNLETRDLARANDVLVTAFTSANTDLTQLGQAFKFAGPVAASAGIQFEEVAASLALMGNAGIQATMAGTGLRGAITRLLTPTSDSIDVMNRLGVSVLDAHGNILPLRNLIAQFESVGLNAADAMTLFGQRAGPAMLALISQGSDALDTLVEKMQQSGGTAERIADAQLDTLQGQLTLLKSAFEGLALEIGRVFVPAIRSIAEFLQPVISSLGHFIERHPDIARWVGISAGVLAGFGAVMFTLGVVMPPVVTATRGLAIAMVALGRANIKQIATTILSVGAAASVAAGPVTALVAAALALPTAIDAISAFMSSNESMFLGRDATRRFREGGNVFQVFAAELGDRVSNAFNSVNDAVFGTTGAIEEFEDTIADAERTVDKMMGEAGTGKGLEGLPSVLREVKTGFEGTTGAITGLRPLQTIFDTTTGKLRLLTDGFRMAGIRMNEFEEFVRPVTDHLNNAFLPAIDKLANETEEVGQTWGQERTNFMEMFDTLTGQRMVAGQRLIVDPVEQQIGAIHTRFAAFVRSLPDRINSINTFGERLQNAFTSPILDATDALEKMKKALEDVIPSPLQPFGLTGTSLAFRTAQIQGFSHDDATSIARLFGDEFQSILNDRVLPSVTINLNGEQLQGQMSRDFHSRVR